MAGTVDVMATINPVSVAGPTNFADTADDAAKLLASGEGSKSISSEVLRKERLVRKCNGLLTIKPLALSHSYAQVAYFFLTYLFRELPESTPLLLVTAKQLLVHGQSLELLYHSNKHRY